MATLAKNLRRCSLSALAVIISFSVLMGYSSHTAHASSMEYKDQDLSIERGHVDVFYPFIQGGKLLQGLEYGNTLYNPNRSTITVPVTAYSEKDLGHPELKYDTSYGYWFLDQSQSDMNVAPYPGWDTGEGRDAVGARTSHDATADIVVTRVSAPEDGKVLIFDSGEMGGAVKSFEKDDKDDTEEEGSRFAMPGILHQDSLSHQHANWMFTAAGTYHLDVKTIITSKTTGKSVSTGVVRYTFIVKDNTGKVYSDEDNIVTELSKVPSSQPDNPSEPTQPTDNPSNPSSEFKILGNRDKGAHAHFHSYEYSGLSLYVPQDSIPKGTQNLEWRYVRADEKPDEGTTLYARSLELPAEPAMNNMMVYVRALDGHVNELASAKAHIAVDDHGSDMRPVVRAIADERVYKPGETVHFTSKIYNPRVPTDAEGLGLSNPVGTITSIVQKRVWLIKKKGEKTFTKIDIPRDTDAGDGTLTRQIDTNYDLVVDESMDGATVRASLEFEDGTLYRNEKFDDFGDVILSVKSQTPSKPETKPETKPDKKSDSAVTVPPAPVPTVVPGDAPKNSGVYDTSHSGAGLSSKTNAFTGNSAAVTPATLSPQVSNFAAPASIGAGAGSILSTGASVAAPSAQDEGNKAEEAAGQSTLLDAQETSYKPLKDKKKQKNHTVAAQKTNTAPTPWVLMVSAGVLTVALCAMAVVATILVVKRRIG